MGALIKVMVWGGLLLAAVNLLAILLSGNRTSDADAAPEGLVPMGSPSMIWFGLLAAAAGIAFDRWTRNH